MVLLSVFMFRLLCLLAPCDPQRKPPEVRSTPEDPVDISRNAIISETSPIVKTTAGVVEGYYGKSEIGRQFFAFEGIPYGESTAGRRRWKPPLPKKPWSGVRSAKRKGTPCLQIDSLRLIRVYGSEDCLFLNVYTPNLPTQDIESLIDYKLPVIVYIHGGAFVYGTGNDYGPTYLMNEDVIVVTFNYRLGILGFLSSGDMSMPGNYGLKDQALALTWVHENIEYFGGNKENVTLMGNSAGGVSTHLHLISTKTRNYFSTAFASSGTAFQYWGVQPLEHIARLTRRLGQTFGCNYSSHKRNVQCLTRIDSTALVAAQFNLYTFYPFPLILFSPVVEVDHPDAFLSHWPSEAYKAGLVAKKPFILGYTEKEGMTVLLGLLPLFKTLPLRVMWDQIAPHYLDYQDMAYDREGVTKEVTKFYFNGTTPRRASLDLLTEPYTDRFIKHGVIKGLQAHTQSGAPSYFYYFSFRGNKNIGNALGYEGSEWGAGHVEDMTFIFNSTLFVSGHDLSDPDHELSTIMIRMLVSFAKTGEPSCVTDSGEVYHIWKPVQNMSDIKGIQFDKSVEMIDLPKEEVKRLRFWSSLAIPNVTLWSPL